MRPIYFGNCFGWLHPASSRRGVVLCGPHGYEYQSVHRSWRSLAIQLAAAGLSTLRFDYPGTGDSSGDDADPGRLAAWLDSIRSAVQYLKAQTGVEEIALVGLRLGALLAAHAAERMTDVTALALMAPPLTGRDYVRQMKILSLAAPFDSLPPPVPRPQAETDLEAAGAVLTNETMAALGILDLLALTDRPAPRVLLLDRTDISVAPRLAAKWRELGARVDVEPLEGYHEMMRSAPELAQAPAKILATLVHWLSADAPARSVPAIPKAPARIELSEASEIPIQFGRDGKLFGIYCTPRPAKFEPRQPVVLFLNTGANSHSGVHRLTVRQARHLAERGIASLRIDIAGVGDSDARPGGGPEKPIDMAESCLDVQAALDWLEAAGHHRFAIFGICSGANLGFNTATIDKRIGKLVLVNPHRFTLIGDADRLHRWMRKTVDQSPLSALIPRSFRSAYRLATLRSQGSDPVLHSFKRLAERGVDILLVYSSQDKGISVMELYFKPYTTISNHLPNVRVELMEGADHSMSKRWARDHLTGLLEREIVGQDAEPVPDAPRNSPASMRTG